MLTFSRFTRYFAAIAELGSIRKAAEALHVSASAIDRQVLQAEKTIGAPLFERFHGGLRPTAAGEIFIGLIRRWQQEYQHALAQVDELQGLKRGHVEIAVIDALTEGMVAEAIGRISAAHPGLTVGVQVLDNEEVARQISSCAVDFGLLLQPASMTGLEALHSIDIPLGVVFQRGHILGEHARLRLSQTLDFKTILPGAPLVISDHVNALYERHQVDTSTFMSCNNTQMMRSLVREGVGIGVLCWLDVVADVSHQRLEFRALEDPRLLPLKLHLCVASRRQISYTARESIPYFQKSMVGTEYDDAIQPARLAQMRPSEPSKNRT
jgi:DNA-binding transcriptional LysR family regulator